MKVGIVGSEAAKFTLLGEVMAQALICSLLEPEDSILVSGGCHLGGVDIWAEQAADKLGRQKIIYLPKAHSWEHYKERNLQIAATSDIVHCISVDSLPKEFKGMRHKLCYHCGSSDHVKSGGCWTMKKAKQGRLHIIQNYQDGGL